MDPLLEVRGVTKMFGGVVALRDVSFTVDQGELVGLIGPNGSGKTTMCNVVTGMEKPNKGLIALEGTDITRMKPHKLSRLGVGRTFQIVQPFPKMTVESNVMVGATFSSAHLSPKERNARCQEALELVGLIDRRHALAGTLTLGEKKKLELARALSTQSRLLLLDEVMGGLPTEEVQSMVSVVRDINSIGTTVVMVEHVMQAVMALASRIIVLHLGRLIAAGTPHEVANNSEVIGSYLGARAAARLQEQELRGDS